MAHQEILMYVNESQKKNYSLIDDGMLGYVSKANYELWASQKDFFFFHLQDNSQIPKSITSVPER